jgi:MFS family permease
MDEVKLGLKENWKQFTLLVIINAFVGGMVGLERAILPQIAEADFHIAAKTAIFSFIVVFGISKAITNYFTGYWANKFGRKNLLIAGWLVAIPIPFILMYADSWNWIIAANILLGVNQGLTWSSTVVMKIDLVGEKQRGLAMGLNESAGYLALAVVAFATGWIANRFGLRPYPFIIGIGLSLLGFLASWLLIKDTRKHVASESATNQKGRLKNIFWSTSWTDRNLGSVSQAGLINNLNDGMVWGLFPLVLSAKGFSTVNMALVISIYPAVSAFGQLFTGKMADHFCKRNMLYSGMFTQGFALLLFVFANNFIQYILLASILGIGTAMVYPTFLAAIAENTHPDDRAESLGVFRFWRDAGYAFGALLTGVIADILGTDASIIVVALLTLGSGAVIFFRMKCPNLHELPVTGTTII